MAEKSWGRLTLSILGLLTSLYVFLLGLQLLGDSFKCLGGRGAGSMFTAIKNPIAGLMVGILATVLVQSSSTSTSIVVGLVGADQITVVTAIPIIMGANIGTSVTNTIVSMGFVGKRLELQRAFAGATVHDMFNYLTVVTLLPVEIIVAAVQGEGGLLYWLTQAITDSIIGDQKAGELFASPIKEITSPVAKLFVSNNKYVIKALTLGPPRASTPRATNATLCARRLSAAPVVAEAATAEGLRPRGAGAELPGRRTATNSIDCSKYYCVGKELAKNLKKVSGSAFKKLTKCDDYILDPAEPCGKSEKCYMDVGAFYRSYVEEGQIIKGGFTEGAGDVGGGIIAFIFALAFLTLGLLFLTRLLKAIFLGRAKKIILASTKMNDYIALAIGIGITIVAQSSSVVTSALTPFCGMGVLTLEKMFPLTLGANIGTTVTAMIAALAKMTSGTVHIALCHLFFNILGILVWYPVPVMRRVPLGGARLLGLYASFYRATPLVYILVCFVLVPAALLGVSTLFDISVAGGVGLLLFLLATVGGFEFWWIRLGGCYNLITREERERGKEEADRAQREILEGPSEESDNV